MSGWKEIKQRARRRAVAAAYGVRLSEMTFGELMQSLKKGVDIEDLRRAERG